MEVSIVAHFSNAPLISLDMLRGARDGLSISQTDLLSLPPSLHCVWKAGEEDLRKAFSAAGFVWSITTPRQADGRYGTHHSCCCRCHRCCHNSCCHYCCCCYDCCCYQWQPALQLFCRLVVGQVVSHVPATAGLPWRGTKNTTCSSLGGRSRGFAFVSFTSRADAEKVRASCWTGRQTE